MFRYRSHVTADQAALAASVVAVVVSLLSAVYARKIAVIEKERRAEEVSASQVASVTARIESWESSGRMASGAAFGSNTRLVVRNGGPAVAYGVSLAVTSSTRSPLGVENFPLEELAPGEEWHEWASITVGEKLPIRCVLSWRDGRGDQSRNIALSPQQIPT